MKNKTYILIIVNLIILQIGLLICLFFNQQKPQPKLHIEENKKQEIPLPPIKNDISNHNPEHLSYDEIVKCFKKWKEECPELLDYGFYGKSSKEKDLVYAKVTNLRAKQNKPKILVTACIHGNEPLSTATMIWYFGSLLKDYHTNEQVKELLNNREFYFIPVVSPDSYPNSRRVDGVDPNRNFPSSSNPEQISVKPIAELQKFFLEIKPNAVMSGHTYGRVFLIPPGESTKDCPDHDEFVRIIGQMAKMSEYRYIRACDLYMGTGKSNVKPIRTYGIPTKTYNYMVPIHGTETDWYYANGAFAIVVEFGTHQRIPSKKDIEFEFNKTYNAFLHFSQEAPIVKITPQKTSKVFDYPFYSDDFGDE